jgi:thiamine-phosphate pyrophosphorylase
MNFFKEEVVLYAVTDRSWLHGSALPDHLEQALKGGVTCVQLREKQLSQAEFIREAGKSKICAPDTMCR